MNTLDKVSLLYHHTSRVDGLCTIPTWAGTQPTSGLPPLAPLEALSQSLSAAPSTAQSVSLTVASALAR